MTKFQIESLEQALEHLRVASTMTWSIPDQHGDIVYICKDIDNTIKDLKYFLLEIGRKA